MSRAWVVLCVWAGMILLAAIVLWGIFPPAPYPSGWLQYLMPAVAVFWLGCFALAAGLHRKRRLAEMGREVRHIPDLSLATTWTAVAIALFLFGLYIGPWLYIMGAGAIVIGALGIVRERRAVRREAEDHAEDDRAPRGPAARIAGERSEPGRREEARG